MSDDDQKTPRVSQSFSFWRSAAEALAIRLDECARIKSKVPHAIDRAGAQQATDLAAELRSMAARFEAWKTANPEQILYERTELTGRLLDVQRTALNLIATVPSMPPRST